MASFVKAQKKRQTASTYPSFHNMNQLGVFQLFLGQDAGPSTSSISPLSIYTPGRERQRGGSFSSKEAMQ